MGRLITALLCKNEAERDLTRVLTVSLSFSSAVCLLDDRSTDASPKIARSMGCKVKERSILKSPAAWGSESQARRELWEWGAEEAGPGGWLLVCDADMVLHGDPRDLVKTWELNAWGFVLADLWSETEYRIDGPWGSGPQIARPWLFRPDACPEPQWPQRGIHPGHAPQNFPLVMGVAPPELYWWEHRAYVNPERRKAKHIQYLSVRDQLTPAELAHAESIVD